MAQSGGRNLFIDAEFDLLDKAYTSALPKFERVLESDPENCNYNYRVGYCLINIPGRTEEAIPYLEKAVLKTTADYKEGNFKEDQAPFDAFLFLGNAYKTSNQMNKAEEAYNQFISKVDKSETEKIEYAQRQMNSLKIAEKLKENPVDFKRQNLGDVINNDRMNYCPAISGDMKTLAFTSIDLNGINFIYISHKDEDGNWSKPKDITRTIGSVGDCKTTGLNSDGTKLLLVKQDNFDSDIYMAEFKDGKWDKMYKLNKYINSKKAWETHASFAPDDKAIYFTSDRKKGLGGYDIYVSYMDDNGWFGFAENLGAPINTEFHEETPFLTNDDILFYSSQGNNSMGGFDIFYSKKTSSGKWEKPANLGYPINTVNDDLFYAPMNSRVFALFSKYYEDGFGGLDIYKFEVFSEDHPRYIEIMGTVTLADGSMNYPEGAMVNITDNSTGFELAKVPVNSVGGFSYSVRPGSYTLSLNTPGYKEATGQVIAPNGFSDDIYYSNLTLEPGLIAQQPKDTLIMSDNDLINNLTNTTTDDVIKTGPETISLLTENTEEEKHQQEDTKEERISLLGPTKNTKRETNIDDDASRVETKDNMRLGNSSAGEKSNTFTSNNYPTYTIQVMALKRYQEPTAFTNMQGVMVMKANDGFYHYLYGKYAKREDARKDLSYVISQGFRFAYIMEMEYFVKNKSYKGYTIQIMALKRYNEPEDFFNNNHFLLKVSKGYDGYYRYTIGQYYSLASARKELEKIKELGYSNAYIREIAEVSGY